MTLTAPYEFTSEFTQLKSALKERLLPILETKLLLPQSDLSKEDAACSYIQGMTELHKKFLAHSSLPERDRLEYLRVEICAAADEVGGYVPGRRRSLTDYRDFLIRQNAAERPKANIAEEDVKGGPLAADHAIDTSEVSPSLELSLKTSTTTPLQETPVEKRTVRVLNLPLIDRWVKDNGYSNTDLMVELKLSDRAISSLRNNGNLHGRHAITKLANLMKCDPEDLYLP